MEQEIDKLFPTWVQLGTIFQKRGLNFPCINLSREQPFSTIIYSSG